MNRWRLKLAPHKCSQITFWTGRGRENDRLDVYLYDQQLPYDHSPKFLGVKFDRNLTFKTEIEYLTEKTTDRLNLLKALSFNKEWALPEKVLIQIFKSLMRSVIE